MAIFHNSTKKETQRNPFWTGQKGRRRCNNIEIVKRERSFRVLGQKESKSSSRTVKGRRKKERGDSLFGEEEIFSRDYFEQAKLSGSQDSCNYVLGSRAMTLRQSIPLVYHFIIKQPRLFPFRDLSCPLKRVR